MYDKLDRAVVGEIAMRSSKGVACDLTALYWAVFYELSAFSPLEATLRKRLQALRKQGFIEHVPGRGWVVRT